MLEITLKDTIDPSFVVGEFSDFISDLNIAAASGKQYVIATESREGVTSPAAFETRSITRIREIEESYDFIGR